MKIELFSDIEIPTYQIIFWNVWLKKVLITMSGLNALLCVFSDELIWILPLFVAAVVSVGPQRDLTAAAAQAATGQPLFNQATVQAAQPNYIQYIPNYQVQLQRICCMLDIWYPIGCIMIWNWFPLLSFWLNYSSWEWRNFKLSWKWLFCLSYVSLYYMVCVIYGFENIHVQ